MMEMVPQMGAVTNIVQAGAQRMVALVTELVRLNGPYSGYDVRDGTTTDRFDQNTFQFSLSARTIDLTIEDNDATVALSYDGIAYNKPFYVKAGVVYSIGIGAKGMQIRSRVNGQQARFQAVVMV